MVSEMEMPCTECGDPRQLHGNLLEGGGEAATLHTGPCAAMGGRCKACQWATQPAAAEGWIGVDLDGVRVEWDPKYLPGLGPPIAGGVALVLRLLQEGQEVRIFTA